MLRGNGEETPTKATEQVEDYCYTCGAGVGSSALSSGSLHGLIRCADCKHPYCELHAYPCPACGAMLCSACTDAHDCCPIGEKLPKYLATPRRKFSYGVEIEVPGAHDQEPLKASRLIAGWCSEDSVQCPGAGEYQTQPLTCPADTAELTRLIRTIDPRGGTISDAGGHIHVKRTDRQHAALWLEALTALDAEACRAMNMRHPFEGENYYCKPIHSYTGKHVTVNDEHMKTIELRSFGPWWQDTADKLEPAVQWIHGMWDWFEENAPRVRPEGNDQAIASGRDSDAVILAAREVGSGIAASILGHEHGDDMLTHPASPALRSSTRRALSAICSVDDSDKTALPRAWCSQGDGQTA